MRAGATCSPLGLKRVTRSANLAGMFVVSCCTPAQGNAGRPCKVRVSQGQTPGRAGRKALRMAFGAYSASITSHGPRRARRWSSARSTVTNGTNPTTGNHEYAAMISIDGANIDTIQCTRSSCDNFSCDSNRARLLAGRTNFLPRSARSRADPTTTLTMIRARRGRSTTSLTSLVGVLSTRLNA